MDVGASVVGAPVGVDVDAVGAPVGCAVVSEKPVALKTGQLLLMQLPNVQQFGV
jgi:hypothetical protein